MAATRETIFGVHVLQQDAIPLSQYNLSPYWHNSSNCSSPQVATNAAAITFTTMMMCPAKPHVHCSWLHACTLLENGKHQHVHACARFVYTDLCSATAASSCSPLIVTSTVCSTHHAILPQHMFVHATACHASGGFCGCHSSKPPTATSCEWQSDVSHSCNGYHFTKPCQRTHATCMMLVTGCRHGYFAGIAAAASYTAAQAVQHCTSSKDCW
jgi:hypothetical protein